MYGKSIPRKVGRYCWRYSGGRYLAANRPNMGTFTTRKKKTTENTRSHFALIDSLKVEIVKIRMGEKFRGG